MSDRPPLRMNRRRLVGLAGLGLASALTWDVVRAGGTADVTGPENRPTVDDQEVAAYVRGCTAFGLDLLAELVASDPDRNLMLSPLGLSGALAMTWAGARGETERRMRETLHYPHGKDRLHAAVGALQYDLDRRGRSVQHREFPRVWNVNRFELGLANALWGQAGYPFSESFLDTLADTYGSDLRSVDFDTEPVAARRRINRWARQASGGHVEELVPPRAIDRFTVFVLANAVYLRADWQQPFDPDDTEPGTFTRADGSTVRVPMMHQEGEFSLLWVPEKRAADGVGYRAAELPYVGGDVSMVLVVPWPERSLADLEDVVDAAWLEALFADLDEREPGEAMVTMPRFTFGNDLELTAQLKALGMTSAFDTQANFGGMTDPPSAAAGLYLDWVFHDTHVAVDEEGTIAVAVSAIGGEQVSAPPSIWLDRPFLFCIRDRETDAVLFLGRVVDPSRE
jgi:serpin B